MVHLLSFLHILSEFEWLNTVTVCSHVFWLYEQFKLDENHIFVFTFCINPLPLSSELGHLHVMKITHKIYIYFFLIDVMSRKWSMMLASTKHQLPPVPCLQLTLVLETNFRYILLINMYSLCRSKVPHPPNRLCWATGQFWQIYNATSWHQESSIWGFWNRSYRWKNVPKRKTGPSSVPCGWVKWDVWLSKTKSGPTCPYGTQLQGLSGWNLSARM